MLSPMVAYISHIIMQAISARVIFSIFLLIHIYSLLLLYQCFQTMPRVYNWESFREELADMYLLHNIQLKDIMIEMSTCYGFNPR